MDKPQEFEKSKTEKFLNLILCRWVYWLMQTYNSNYRKDLAEKKLTEKPVPVAQLVSFL
jgi:hypothetical protein